MSDRPVPEDLLTRLEAFEFDAPGTTLTFAARLARENGWSRSRALRVLDEYRRFLFLACVADHVVTPSEDVDRAWHLHLTYTRSYWEDLCRETLGRELHHQPTEGGTAESEKYRELYEATRGTYARTFGAPPPLDVWPGPEKRFGEDLRARWVNVRRSWVVPRPRILGGRAAALGVAPPVALLALGALPNPFDLSGPEFLLLYLVLLVAAVTVSLGARARARVEATAVDVDAIDAETAAVLAHGEPGAGRAALARLLFQGTLDVEGRRVRVARPADPGATRVERAIVERAAESESARVEEVLAASEGAAADLRARMEVRGLLETDEAFAPARRVTIALFLALLGFGAVRVALGIERERPVLLLVALMVAAAIALFALTRRPFRTQVGERALARLRRRVPRPRRGLEVDDVPMDTASTAVGLWGGSAVGDERLGSIAEKLDPPQRDPGSSGAGWGGGCSSDGGGGGCGGGGCGGCGG